MNIPVAQHIIKPIEQAASVWSHWSCLLFNADGEAAELHRGDEASAFL